MHFGLAELKKGQMQIEIFEKSLTEWDLSFTFLSATYLSKGPYSSEGMTLPCILDECDDYMFEKISTSPGLEHFYLMNFPRLCND